MLSLIVATVGRICEAERLLASLDTQTYRDFEVIVVDQNTDDRLVEVVQRHRGLSIVHLRAERGCSHARNVGLSAARGEIICFPDDDCWYPGDLLALVSDWFKNHPEFGGLFAGMRAEDGRRMAPKWAPGPCRCTKENIWFCASPITAFLRKEVVKAVGFFNEEIGPGTTSKYQSGEDIDYLIRPLEYGFEMWHEPSMTVYHPKLNSLEGLRRRTYPYALGVGYILRIHDYSWWYLSKMLGRSISGAVLYLCKADFARARIYLSRAVGQLRGYVFGPRDIRRQAKSSVRTMADTA